MQKATQVATNGRVQSNGRKQLEERTQMLAEPEYLESKLVKLKCPFLCCFLPSFFLLSPSLSSSLPLHSHARSPRSGCAESKIPPALDIKYLPVRGGERRARVSATIPFRCLSQFADGIFFTISKLIHHFLLIFIEDLRSWMRARCGQQPSLLLFHHSSIQQHHYDPIST